jgi:hypothetical protein
MIICNFVLPYLSNNIINHSINSILLHDIESNFDMFFHCPPFLPSPSCSFSLEKRLSINPTKKEKLFERSFYEALQE